MNQIAKEYIENYLEYSKALTNKAKESIESSVLSNQEHENAVKAAEVAVPMLEILALETDSKSQ